MPQMAPMNWTFLFIIFISLLVILLNKLYFNKELTYTPSMNLEGLKIDSAPQYWVW